MPTFKNHPQQPQGNQSCGAYALAAALFQLEVAPPPHNITLYPLDLANTAHGYIALPTATLTPTQDQTAFAQALYPITGNLSIDSARGTAYYGAHTTTMLNAPSALVYAAKQFGLHTVEIHATPTAQHTFEHIQCGAVSLWKSEVQILKNTLHVAPITSQAYAPPTNTKTVDLVLVDDGEHWVAVTWSGTQAVYYDSATGQEQAWPGTKTPTGIWIRLSK